MSIQGAIPMPSRSCLPRDLVAYFLLTFAISWAIEVPLALQAQGVIRHVVPLWLHYAASFGPLLAATIVHSGHARAGRHADDGVDGLLGSVLELHGPANLSLEDKGAI